MLVGAGVGVVGAGGVSQVVMSKVYPLRQLPKINDNVSSQIKDQDPSQLHKITTL